MPPALELRGIVKRFPGVVANDRVDLAVEAGEIRALVGENGAGKTTLMRVAYGLYRPDAGEIRVHGQSRRWRSPVDAIRAGLGMVHQHFMLFPSLTAAENVVYGAEPGGWGLLDRRRAMARVAELAGRYGLEVDPGARVGDLPVGIRQRIEILKTLYRGGEILILDEPTAVLTPTERDALFAVLERLAARGRSVVFITHKLQEVLRLAHRATVLRDGRVAGTVEISRTTPEELSRLMVGREMGPPVERPLPGVGEAMLEVEGLAVPGRSGLGSVRGVSFQVRAGEIVGLAGAAGNGQTEMVEAIVGLRPSTGGGIFLAGREITHLSVSRRRQAGVAYIPGDRDGVGLALGAAVAENLCMGMEGRAPLSRRGLLSPRAMRERADEAIADYGVKVTGPAQTVGQLSGGNRQKLVVARELARPSRLLIAEHPTRGADVISTEFIHRKLASYREAGGALFLVSADLGELRALSDRILVMFEGRIVGEVEEEGASEEELGLLMGGASSGRGAQA